MLLRLFQPEPSLESPLHGVLHWSPAVVSPTPLPVLFHPGRQEGESWSTAWMEKKTSSWSRKFHLALFWFALLGCFKCPIFTIQPVFLFLTCTTQLKANTCQVILTFNIYLIEQQPNKMFLNHRSENIHQIMPKLLYPWYFRSPLFK